jgi:hypothetical protein
MLTAFATFFRESSSLECSSMYLRAFQIATGSARLREAAFLASAADNILITSPNKLTVADSRAVLSLPIPHPILGKLGLRMPESAKTHSPDVPLAAVVYRRWRRVPCDRISDGIRIAPQILLPSSSDPYRFWGRCILGRFRKERSARLGKENSPSLRGASRAPFVSRALLAFFSSDLKSSQASDSAPRLLAFALQNLRCLLRRSASHEGCSGNAICAHQFLQRKGQETWSMSSVVALLIPTKERSMEYLILVAVVSVMALYALIIVVCLKQPEW